MAVKVFVGSLPGTIDDLTFRSLFESYGNVVSAVCNPAKRYGFVNFSTVDEANQAIAAMNGYMMDGQSIVCKQAQNQGAGGGGYSAGGGAPPAGGCGGGCTAMAPYGAMPSGGGGGPGSPCDRIYLKGLPKGMDNKSVREIFEAYGTVVDTHVLVNDGLSSDGTGQSVAIVRLGTLDEASWLVTNLNGNIPQGLMRPVEVTFAGSKAGGKGDGGKGSPYAGFGGKGGGPMMGGGMGGMGGGMQVGGFEAMNGGKGGWGGKGDGSWGGQGNGGPARLGSDVLVPSVSQRLAQAGPACSLYVKGLPMGADDLYLYKAFAPFGAVLSAKAITKEDYVIGFVHYATDAETQQAISNLTGQPLLDGTVLTVQVKQQK